MTAGIAVRGLMAIAAREVSERVTLLGLAVALAVVPFVAPGLGIGDRPLLEVFLATVMVVTAAVLTGSSVIARDLAEGRLGFFFARPQPWWSIWGGKMLAAVVLTFAAGAIAIVPVLMSLEGAGPAGRSIVPAARSVAVLAPGLLALIGLAHVLAVAYRARSGWFALDLAMVFGLGLLATRAFRTLTAWGVSPVDFEVAAAVLWFLAVVLTLAGAVQVAQGRSDLRRGHRVISIVFWSCVTPAVLAYVAFAAWVQRPSPGDFGTMMAAWAAPKGTWIAAAGRGRWPRPESAVPALLVDTATGRFVRAGSAFAKRGPVFSNDGHHAAWVSDWWTETPRLMVVDLEAGDPEPSPVALPVSPGGVFSISLSADGRAAAIVQASQVTVFPVGSSQPAVVALTRLSWSREAVFSADGRVHVLGGRTDPQLAGDLDLLVLDPATGGVSVTGHIPTRGNAIDRWSPDARRLAVIHRLDHRPSLTLHDGTTGALLASPVPEGSTGRLAAVFLQDGRLAVVEGGVGIRLRVFTTDGLESVSVDISRGFAATRVIEVAPGILAVDQPLFGGGQPPETVIVDASSGRILRRDAGLRTAAIGLFGNGTNTSGPASLFIDEKGALVRLDTATGARDILLGGR
jgi:hypothetical protein